MSEIFGNVVENLPVSPAEAPKQGVSSVEQSAIETITDSPVDGVGNSEIPSGILKESQPIVPVETEFGGYGYEPVIASGNGQTSGGRATEIVLAKRNGVPVNYLG